MGQSDDLLKLLEPAIRPVGSVVRRQDPQAPFEEQSFESLLNQAKQQPTTPGGPGEAETMQSDVDPLAPLAGLNQVHSPSLRDLIARLHGQ